MQVIVLSGGSDFRLWPLSNEARSTQYLKLLTNPISGEKESLIQRVVRQLKEAKLDHITITTFASQVDSTLLQLGKGTTIVTEPSRNNTFPAVSLVCEYLAQEKEISNDEVVAVIPCDLFVNSDFYERIIELERIIKNKEIDLGVIGIHPTTPSPKFGYIVPENENKENVARFVEKPMKSLAQEIITQGGIWNSGVYVFKLSFLLTNSRKYCNPKSFNEAIQNYNLYPKRSIDYEIAEKTKRMVVLQYDGLWKDLGNWDTFTKQISESTHENIYGISDDTNTHIINELGLPLICLGTHNLIVAATPEGILISDKGESEQLKEYKKYFSNRPMYEERRWGSYRVLNQTMNKMGERSLTKILHINANSFISYQRHNKRTEVWTCIEGIGELVIDNVRRKIKYGDTIIISVGQLHTIRAITPLSIIEVQLGTELVEGDIERFTYKW